MIFKQNILLKTYKRYINTKILHEALLDMNAFSVSNKSENIKENLFYLETIEGPDNKVYEDILQNIQESENLLSIVRDNLILSKKNELNLNIKVEEVVISNDKKIITNLNDKASYFKDERDFIEITLDDVTNFSDNTNTAINILNNTRKNLWDIAWLQPFFDFMHNHSTLVFTVGGGMLPGGILYLNNFGLINIGSLVTRLGLNLFNSSLPQSTSTNVNPIHITVENSQNNVREISSGFFRELGKELLVVIDLYIEKLKDNRMKYK